MNMNVGHTAITTGQASRGSTSMHWKGWSHPQRETQLGLFTEPADAFLTALRVSVDEVARWFQLGWISFDPKGVAEYSNLQAQELSFVVGLARSGLSDAKVTALLHELEPPYTYDPIRTAYHFQFGWVAAIMPEVDPFEVIECHIEEWMEHCLDNHQMELLDRIVACVCASRNMSKQE